MLLERKSTYCVAKYLLRPGEAVHYTTGKSISVSHKALCVISKQFAAFKPTNFLICTVIQLPAVAFTVLVKRFYSEAKASQLYYSRQDKGFPLEHLKLSQP